MSLVLWRVGVPAAAFLCGTLLGLSATAFLSLLVPGGVFLGFALGAVLSSWVAFQAGERAAPDHSRGRPWAILLASLGFLLAGGLPAAALVGALTSLAPNPSGLAETAMVNLESGPLLYQVPAAMIFVAIGAALATWRYRTTRS